MMPGGSSSKGGGRSSQGASSLLKTLISPLRALFAQIARERDPNPSFHSEDSALPLDTKNSARKGKDPINNMEVKSPNVDYSHFVSLPLAIHPKLAEKLHNFQKSVLAEVGMLPKDDIEALGIDRSIFITPQTFHLTVLMLKLWNKDRIAIATETLKGVSSKVMEALENRPVSIRLRGLACMRGSPAKAYVLHIPVEEVGGEGRLLRACQVIIDAFVEAGLVLQRDAHHSLKLHATLMNAKFRKRNKSAGWRDSFDARAIFKRYGSEDWGKHVVTEAHLSQRFAYDRRGEAMITRIAAGHHKEARKPDCIRAVAGEFILTFHLVFVSVGSSMCAGNLAGGDGMAGMTAMALANALVVAVLISAGMRISGSHFNPAVTIGLAMGGYITLFRSVLYILVQLLGSVLACSLLKFLTGGLETPVHRVAGETGVVQGVIMETVLTFFLMFSVYATIMDPNRSTPDGLGPLLIGLLICPISLAGGAFSGASMNPARSFGPALISGNWTHHWVYWAGPIIGSVFAVLIYENFFIADNHISLKRKEESF